MLKRRYGYLVTVLAAGAVAALALLPAATDPAPSTAPPPAQPPAPTSAANPVVTDPPSASSPAPAPPAAPTSPVGDRVHISGCDFGELTTPVVALWDSAARTRVVGELAGDGPADRGLTCLGPVVIIHSVDAVQPTPMYEVETVVGDQRGWVSERFIGPTFDPSLCGAFYSNSSAAAGKCRG